MSDPFEDQLPLIAPFLNALTPSADAELTYDMLSDGLWWTDERPEASHVGEVNIAWAMRPLFRYRTSLIIADPATEGETLWCQARDLFPSWPGFVQSRCEPSEFAVEYYRSASKTALESLDRMDRVWERWRRIKERNSG